MLFQVLYTVRLKCGNEKCGTIKNATVENAGLENAGLDVLNLKSLAPPILKTGKATQKVRNWVVSDS